ncbi:hypothetical protein VRU48_08140 [Pedobacter sp. KR3-3]|uniref:DUF4435 domain-containing protein n=1 Tax=Pedobacter albus TaxID=3113905 RepID=A0ABU7I6G6_9SPHI|nr:hypothetical protein [Pedobacter sp. KR3-3]MEE1945073.1 hypothetical protein [Pedobacter sp. KR3-3]
MNNFKKSLIDNWSLEHAGILLENRELHKSLNEQEFITSMGGLSNYINSMLLYDDTNFIANGFESDWQRFEWFQQNTLLFVKPINSDSLNIDWNSQASYSDKGIRNYLVSARQFETDLFVSPERADRIITERQTNINSPLDRTLEIIDEKIKNEKDSLWYNNLQVGIEHNFIFPSITHYVLSQATSSEDLLTVIIQLKDSGKVKSLRNKIEEITSNIKTASKFRKDVEQMIKEQFGESAKSDKPWSLKFTVLFLTLTKSFNLDFFKRKEYLLFLKDIITCRTEANGLAKDIERVFGKRILNS